MLCCLLSASWMSAQDSVPATTFSSDTLVLNNDSVLIIVTVCAPVCSSYVTVENAKGDEIGKIRSPFLDAVFPEAYIEDRRLKWRDNTWMMMDEDERRWMEANQK